MEPSGASSRKAALDLQLTTFNIPPAGEVLVLGKRAPIGPQAAKTMLDTVAPDQFELVQLDDDVIEAMLIKKYLFLRADREALIRAIFEEAKAIMNEQDMIAITANILVTVRREIQG